MSTKKRPGTAPGFYVHIHLVSDSTGETLVGILRAASAQFKTMIPIEHIHVLSRSSKQLETALAAIEEEPGLVLFTMVNDEPRETLKSFCAQRTIPAIDVLGPTLNIMSQYLGTQVSHQTGAQHIQDEVYHQRINALNFAMAHDDGLLAERVQQADVVLLGVSRTSKTPTSVYLANRGIKTANIPIVSKTQNLDFLQTKNQPLIVGLTISPRRLVQIRRNRLLSLNESHSTDYIDEQAVRDEIIYAKRLYARNDWPVIDVTRRSIEETAAKIIYLLSQKRES